MATPRKAMVFRERAELLDFLLEVSRITSETLDLDKLLENVASIVKTVIPYDLFAILLYSRSRAGAAHSVCDRASRRSGAEFDDSIKRRHHGHGRGYPAAGGGGRCSQ